MAAAFGIVVLAATGLMTTGLMTVGLMTTGLMAAPAGALSLSASAPAGALSLSASAPAGALSLSALAPDGALSLSNLAARPMVARESVAAAAVVTCGPGGDVETTYTSAGDGVGQPPTIHTVHLANLPAACEGLHLVLGIRGNTAGDPALATVLLSTVDSSLAPCTLKPVPAGAGLVRNGAITFTLCPAGGVDGVVSVHDITELDMDGTVLVAPAGTQVLAVTDAPAAGVGPAVLGAQVTRAAAPSSLAFTGGPALFLAGVGALLCAAGLVVLILALRR